MLAQMQHPNGSGSLADHGSLIMSYCLLDYGKFFII
jgi:hypothetical protein